MPEWSAEERARALLSACSPEHEGEDAIVSLPEATAFAEECYRAGAEWERDEWMRLDADREFATCGGCGAGTPVDGHVCCRICGHRLREPSDAFPETAEERAIARAGHAMAERDELRALLDARDDHTAEEVGYAAVLARAERAEAERDALRAALEESE